MKILVGTDRYKLDTVIPELSQKFPDVEFDLCTNRENIIIHIADADVFVGWLSRDDFLAGKKLLTLSCMAVLRTSAGWLSSMSAKRT